MSATLHVLPTTDEDAKVRAIRMLELMRGKVDSGEIVMFAAVGLAKSDDVSMFVGGGGKTNTQMIGALTILHHVYLDKAYKA